MPIENLNKLEASGFVNNLNENFFLSITIQVCRIITQNLKTIHTGEERKKKKRQRCL